MSDEVDKPQDAPATEKGAADGPGKKGPVLARMALDKRVQAATGAKMADVRAIVRATLDAMGTALRSGERLNLPPFGMARPLKTPNDKPGVTRIVLRETEEKVRPAAAAKPPAVAKPKAVAKRAGKGKKQALAAKGEAE